MSRRSRLVCALVSGVLLTGCAQAGDSFVVDREGEALNLRRLSIAVDDLDAVRGVKYVVPDGNAYVHGCLEDSGDVFEPMAGRTWAVPKGPETRSIRTRGDALATPTRQGRAAMVEIATQLKERGWSGAARVVEAEGTFGIDLQLMRRPYDIALFLQADDEVITATAHTVPEPVCSARQSSQARASQ